MARVPAWRRYLRLFGPDVQGDVDDEIRFHLAAKREELMNRGLPPRDAEVEASRRFGDQAEVRQMCVRMEKERLRNMHWKERLWLCGRDVKYALRQLRLNPGFTLTAILSLALGIGANTAIFTLSDQILLRLLPVKDPRELVQLRAQGGRAGSQNGDGIHTFSYPTYLALRDRNTVLSGLTGEAVLSTSLVGADRSDVIRVGLVAGNYFEVFGVAADQGRVLAPADDRVKMGSPVAVLQDAFWRTRFGGSPDVVGSTIRLNGFPFTVVGVAAARFEGTNVGSPTSVWVPVTMKPAITPVDNNLEDERYAWFSLFGRLKPGVSIAQAEAAMKVTHRHRIEEEAEMPYFQRYPLSRPPFLKQVFALEPSARGQSSLRAQFERPLIVLQWLVGAVLLIACSNIAGLLLARGAARQRELAIRGALGAGRGPLIRQLLTESVVLAAAGGTLGILVSGWAVRGLIGVVSADPSRMSLTAAPDLRVLLFAIGVTLLTTVLFGLFPAWQSSHVNAAEVLKESAGAVAGARSHVRLRKAFVALQVGLSTLLLIGACLFARTFWGLRSIDLGFPTASIVTFYTGPATVYDDGRKLQLYRNLIESLATTPGVKAVGANTSRLLTGGRSDGAIHLANATVAAGDTPHSYFHAITPGYLEAMGIRLQSGRELTWRDWGSSRKYCVVNQALARDYFGGHSPVGAMLGRGSSDAPLEYEIAGVFADSRYDDPRGRVPPQTFFAMDSRIHFVSGVNVYARVEGDPRAAMAQLREKVRQVDSNLVVTDVRTLDDQLNLRLANERMLAYLSLAFAILATLLACSGLYGVLSYVVARRRREIGIRMALGARRGMVIRLVMREMAAVIFAGIAAGVAAAATCGTYVQNQLYGVKAFDPAVFLISVAALAACSLAAASLPAWRASRLDPGMTLRQE